MKLSTDYREEAGATFKGTKDHYLVCHVEFSEEERAIVQERGLYDQFVLVPSDAPPPTRVGDFKSMLMRVAGIILAPLGLLSCCVQFVKPAAMAGAGLTPAIMLIAGVALFTIGKWKDIQANRREANPDQTLTIRSLLTNPDFVVHAHTPSEAREYEETVREAFGDLAQTIRKSAPVSEKNTYEL
jgi:hypothetical protein